MVSVLGTDLFGKNITIDQGDRKEGTYIIGATGTGKSTLIENLILEDIKQGVGLGVLDPHGDLINRVIERVEVQRFNDIIYLDLADPAYVFGLNLFHCDDITDPFAVTNTLSQVMHVLEKVYDISRGTPQMNQYFLNIAQTFIYNPQYNILDIHRLLDMDNPSFRNMLAAHVPNMQVKWFWETFFPNRSKYDRERDISAITNKLDEFFQPILRPIFGQEKRTINMREIMDEGKILLVKLAARWDSITSLVGSILVSQISDAAYSRGTKAPTKRRQWNLYADEFQRFATQDFATLFTEARKYGIGLTIAHQTFEQVDIQVRATAKQAANILVFKVSGDNAGEIVNSFDTRPIMQPPEEVGKRRKTVHVNDVVRHIMHKGHDDPLVNQFRNNPFLSQMFGHSSSFSIIAGLNMVLYKAMTGTPILAQDFDDKHNPGFSFLEIFFYHNGAYTFRYAYASQPNFLSAFYTYWITGDTTALYPLAYQEVQKVVMKQLTGELRNISMEYARINIDRPAYDHRSILEELRRVYDPLHSFEKYIVFPEGHYWPGQPTPFSPAPIWYLIDFDRLEWERKIETTPKGNPYESWHIREGQEWKFYNPTDYQAVVNQIYWEHIQKFLACMTELKAVCAALAKKPITENTGEEEVITRNVQQSSTDRHAQIVNQLANLPKHRACMKIPSLGYIVCQKCGGHLQTDALYCGLGCGPVDPIVVLQTVKSNQGTSPAARQQRIASIQANNLAKGYLRKRADVEAEIAARQQPPPPPAAALAPKPKPPKNPPAPKGATKNMPSPAKPITPPPPLPQPARRKKGP